MLKGDLIITNNLESLPIYGANYRLISLSEDKSIATRYGALQGTILLPMYEAVCAEMDNNLEAYYALYYNHLNGYEASALISAVFKALAEGINICLYLPYEAKELRYNIALVEYFANIYGILIATDQPVMYIYQQNPNFYLNILNVMYLNNHIDIDELFTEYPAGLPILEPVLPKLIQEFNAPQMQTLEDYANYFFNYKEKIKLNNNVFLIPGMSFGN